MWTRVFVLCALCAGAEGTRYSFYRALRGGERVGVGGGARRVFGGRAAPLEAYGAACALLDRYWAARCSGAVLAPRWALTAAHCVTPRLTYVHYNTARGGPSAGGQMASVHYLYRHPAHRALTADEGRGPDVTELHHDVGLVRTRSDMRLVAPPATPPLSAMRLHEPAELRGRDVQVLGFGRTEHATLGEALFEVRLRLVACERTSWFHCVCASAPPGGEGDEPGGGGGVCSGDSGGPVLYRGAQVGVTSMGPLECARGQPQPGAASVLTSLYQYADLINATIHDTDSALRMRMIAAGPRAPRPVLTPAVALVALLVAL